MTLNIKDDDREVIFIDLDGTLVIHNYDPEHIDEKLIKKTVEFLDEHKDAYIVLTTSRSLENVQKAIEYLYNEGIHFDDMIYDLPTGKRILVNDHKKGSEDKAFAINLERDRGC